MRALPPPPVRLPSSGLSLAWAVGGADQGHRGGARFRAKADAGHGGGGAELRHARNRDTRERHHSPNLFPKAKVPQSKVLNSLAWMSLPVCAMTTPGLLQRTVVQGSDPFGAAHSGVLPGKQSRNSRESPREPRRGEAPARDSWSSEGGKEGGLASASAPRSEHPPLWEQERQVWRSRV